MKYAQLVLWLVLSTSVGAGTYGSEDVVVCDIPESLFLNFQASGRVTPGELGADPFIHCARPSQMQRVMDKYFKEDEYWIFIMDSKKILPKLRYEGESYSTLYPHIYGVINKNDLLYSFKLKRNTQGRFILPEILKP